LSNDLSSLKLVELREIAQEMGLKSIVKYKKDELLRWILSQKDTTKEVEPHTESTPQKENNRKHKDLPEHLSDEIPEGEEANIAAGILEIHTDGYGFLRRENYLSSDDDIYISPSQIRRFRMRTGDKITGITRPPKSGEKFNALLYVKKINGLPPETATNRPNFEDLTPIYPQQRINLEIDSKELCSY